MNIELQNFLFQEEPSRRELYEYRPQHDGANKKIQVFRNHSFELVSHTIHPFLEYANIDASFSYSGYDDSFSFTELEPDSDLIIIWIDLNRYSSDEARDIVPNRIELLRSRYEGPILVVPFGEDINIDFSNALVFNLSEIEKELGEGFADTRASAITGTSLSAKALVKVSRILGLRYIPALLMPEMKAVAVDFDNTLYSGVLGEDGEDRIVLTEGHRILQEELVKLSKEGIFLCGITKNNAEDVDHMLETRSDFPLKKEHFTVIKASWDAKSSSMFEVLKLLNIGEDAVLFVDDNIGELASMHAFFPNMKLLLAYNRAELTNSALAFYPGMMRIRHTKEDLARKDDVVANVARNEMRAQLSQEEFIKQLGLEVDYVLHDSPHIERISQLSNKTNQFIFSYKRYTEADIHNRMSDEQYAIVTISLKDKLTDSGIIGVCVGHKEQKGVLIEEVFISCRALGRGIDDIIVLGAIKLITEKLRCDNVRVEFAEGPRNEPAKLFVEEYLPAYLNSFTPFSYSFPSDLIKITIDEA